MENERLWVSAKYKLWIFGENYMIVENQTLAQNTRNEKNISKKCNPSRGQAKVHGFKVVQNTTFQESSAKYKSCS